VLAIVNETSQRVQMEKQRANDILSLNAAALRQRCLVEIGDRLRMIDTKPEIARAAAEILCRALNCTRAGYAKIANGRCTIISDWSNGTVPSLSGEYEFAALGAPYVDPIMRGEPIAVDDVRGHPITAGNPAAWLSIQTLAVMNVPLLENGAPAALMYVHDLEPRIWTAAEISLLKDVADRTWEAMGRARAIQALQALNESLERQVQDRTAERDRMWKLSTDIMLVADFETKIVSVNPAWTALLGWGTEDLIGRSYTEFLHPEDVAASLKRPPILKTGAGVKSENRYRKKDGGYLWISWTSVPDETFIHAVGRDVTAEKEQAEA